MGLFDVVAGGLSGLATGGPAGAAVGAVSGLLGGGSSGRTTTQTQATTLRPFSASEATIIANIEKALAGLTAGSKGSAGREDAIFKEQYDPAEKAISDAWLTHGGKLDAANLRRGGGLSSRMGADQAGVKAGMSDDLASAAATARAGARNAVLAETASSRADMEALSELMSTLYNNRVVGQTGTTTTPNTSGMDAAAGLGAALGNSGSWLNTKGLPAAWSGISSLFGGGGKPNNSLT